MSACDKLRGRLKDICLGTADLPFAKINRYRAAWGIPAMTVEEFAEALRQRPSRLDPYVLAMARERRRRKPSASAYAEPVGTAMRNLIANIVKVKGSATCNCVTLAEQMNQWGIDGCERHRQEIVDKIVANRDMLFQALSEQEKPGLLRVALIARSMLPERLIEYACRLKVNAMLTQAIEITRAEKARRAERSKNSGRRRGGAKRKPYTGWRSEKDGPHHYLGPWESRVRCLTYHIWPTLRSDSWQWNLQQLARRFGLFNGPTAIGIATDHESATANEVVDYAASLGMDFDHVIVVPNNRRLREVATFLPMLHAIGMPSDDPDRVVFSAHAKGAQYNDGTHTREWTERMYDAALDYWPLVEQHLRHAVMTGSFRQFGLLGKWHDWAYSGTFFWWRAAAVSRIQGWDQIDQWFAGTESWPGKLCDPRDTRALFMNDSTNLYDTEYWQTVLRPEWDRWRAKMKAQSNAYRGIRVDPGSRQRSLY